MDKVVNALVSRRSTSFFVAVDTRTDSHRVAQSICLTPICRLIISEMVVSNCVRSADAPVALNGRALFCVANDLCRWHLDRAELLTGLPKNAIQRRIFE